MKTKYLIFLIVTMAVTIVNLCSILNVNATMPAEFKKNFTAEDLSNIKHINATVNESITPIHSGKISFSHSFIIPQYKYDSDKPESHILASAVFCDDGLVGIANFTYYKTLILDKFIYFNEEITERIKNGDKFALVWIDESENFNYHCDWGGCFYLVDDDNDMILVDYSDFMPESYIFPHDLTNYNVDYKSASKYNILSSKMDIEKTFDYNGKKELSKGDIISIKSISGDYWKCAGSTKFIVRELIEDGNGKTIISVSPKNKSSNYITSNGSNEFYLECVTGRTTPAYGIFPVNAPEKAVTLSENGKAVVKKWTYDENQQWLVYVDE